MVLEKKWLNINGAPRMLVYEPDKDTLATTVRRLGLTGTKIGCGSGQCGACSVILNGELARACVKKLKNIADYSEITTIEGLGTPANLHPLQQAWITFGGVQCGFCTPGFIVSAYALLKENPTPTREQVRDWFTAHRNLCRCTGYKPLVDAVMAAAEVMRGEKTMEDITYHHEERIYNSRCVKPTALEKVTGLCDYGNDISLKMPEGTLHLAVVMPDAHHAVIKSIDCSAAEALPGVVKVITAKDMLHGNLGDAGAPNHGYFSPAYSGFNRPVICSDKLYHKGDIVAVVAAIDRRTARAAAKLVKVELEELPAYRDATEALRPDAMKLRENGPDNLYDGHRLNKGPDAREALAKSAYVAEGSFYSQREPHLPIESDIVQAYIDSEGRVTIQNKGQGIHVIRAITAAALGLPPDKLRVIENPTGGSFGYAMSSTPSIIAATATILLGAPVSLELDYREFQFNSGKRSAFFANGRLGCDENGMITGMEIDGLFDMGAHNEMAVKLLYKSCHFFGYPYNIPSVNGILRLGFSNNAFEVTYRGFGMPQTYTCSEALIDMLAEKAGIDPFEFRYKNALRPGDTIITNVPIDEYPIQEMMDMLRPYYNEAKERAAALSGERIKRGVGVVCGGYSAAGLGDHGEADIELNPDGGVTIYNSWEQVGQGADIGTLVHTHEALRPLGIKPEDIRIVQNDTAICPNSGPSAGSRQHYMTGLATIDAANQLMEAMRKADGSYRTYAEMIAEEIPTKYLGRYDVPASKVHYVDTLQNIGRNVPEFNYVVMVAEVEVDIETGVAKCVAAHGVANVGVIGNYLAVEGQAYGGFEHCTGFALTEDFDDYSSKYGTMLGCGFPKCNDVPDELEFQWHITPRPDAPQGSVGCSENFQSCGHMAIINAINNAVGVRIYDLPATPDKIKEALRLKAEGGERRVGPYYTGADYNETYDKMTALAEKLKESEAAH